MKEFVKNYGAALMVLAAAMAVFGVLFCGIETPKGNMGLYSALGEGAEELSKQTQVSASTDKIKEIKSRPLPEVTGNMIEANTEYALTDVFALQNQEIILELKCVKMISGEDVTETTYHTENETLCFSTAGTYRVRILTDDKNGGTADGWVTVKVQD